MQVYQSNQAANCRFQGKRKCPYIMSTISKCKDTSLHCVHAPPGIFVLDIIGIIHDKLLEKKGDTAHAGNMRRGHTDAMFTEHRSEPRECIALPLQFENGSQGMTRDISASGLFFETDREQRVGSLIDLEIEFDWLSGRMKFKAQCEIVRIEPRGDKTGAALKFLVSRLEPVK